MLDNLRTIHVALLMFLLSMFYLFSQPNNEITQYLNQHDYWLPFSLGLAAVLYYALLMLREA